MKANSLEHVMVRSKSILRPIENEQNNRICLIFVASGTAFEGCSFISVLCFIERRQSPVFGL